MEPPRSIAEEESIRRQASEHEEEDGSDRVSNGTHTHTTVTIIHTINVHTELKSAVDQ